MAKNLAGQIPGQPPQKCFNLNGREYNEVREASRLGPTPTLGPSIRYSLQLPPLKAVPKIKEASLKNMNMRNVTLNRRQKIRKMPDRFAFVQMERDDGGSVLDVSEDGLRFETFAPVAPGGPVHLWFSLNLRERIEAWGEVVWTNAAKKCGGVRFLRIAEKDLAQIREWMSRPAIQENSEEQFRQRQVVREMPARRKEGEIDAVARFVSKARQQAVAGQPGAESAGVSSTLFPEPPVVEASGELVPMQRYLSAKRRQLILGLFLGMCISASVAVAAIKLSNYRQEKIGSDRAKPALVAQERRSDAATPPATISSATSGASTDVFAGSSKQNLGVGKVRKPNVQATETGGHAISGAQETTETNLSAQGSPRPISSDSAERPKTTMTLQQLWASVQAGNTKSAVTLAEHYINGDGVPQNCNQARVLLLVASEKRNAAAIKRLAELDKTGCPPQ